LIEEKRIAFFFDYSTQYSFGELILLFERTTARTCSTTNGKGFVLNIISRMH
jgi:hypothetical protein